MSLMRAAEVPSPSVATPSALRPDRLTLVAISALAYVVAVALHEHLGHAATCALLGGHVMDMGAFYVNCDYAGMNGWAVRAVAAAGPLVSALTGTVSFRILRRIPDDAPAGFYFTWLLGSVGLMSAAGYSLFSGISGIGDLGTGPEGVLHGAPHAWVWRVAFAVCGALAYWWVVRDAARRVDAHMSGAWRSRIRAARVTVLISYLTGIVVSAAIGAFNPQGLTIVAVSAIPSSAGGTSGLLWMMQLLDRKRTVSGPGLAFNRSWRWVGIATAITLAYAIVFGPTLRF